MSYAPLSFKVASTISAQRVVYMSAAETAAVTDTITSAPLGITMDTVLDTTSSIPVAPAGFAKLLFNDTVGAGGLVAADASGRGIPFAGVTLTSTYVIGTLAGPAVDATGTIARVLINPHAKYGQA